MLTFGPLGTLISFTGFEEAVFDSFVSEEEGLSWQGFTKAHAPSTSPYISRPRLAETQTGWGGR